MTTNLQRLALMAGITLNEAAAAKIKTIKIPLAHVGLEGHPNHMIEDFIDHAVEAQDILTIEDWDFEGDVIVFKPMLTSGEVSINAASQFRQIVADYLSDPDNFDSAPQDTTRTNESSWVNGKLQDPKSLVWKQTSMSYEDAAKEYGKDHVRVKKNALRDGSDMVEILCPLQEQKTGSNKVFDEYSAWKKAAEKAGCEIYSLGAADGKYIAKKDGEPCGRWNKTENDGWLHSSVIKEANYDDEGNVIPEGPLPQGLAEIARELGFDTLDTRNSDQLDFKEVSVGGVKAALLAAYNLGKQQQTAQSTPAEQQPMSGGLPPPETRTSADHQQAGPAGIAR